MSLVSSPPPCVLSWIHGSQQALKGLACVTSLSSAISSPYQSPGVHAASDSTIVALVSVRVRPAMLAAHRG